MKSLYITSFFAPDIGGIETLSAQLINGLAACGYEFAVFTRHGSWRMPDVTNYGGSQVYRFSDVNGFHATHLRQLYTAQRQLHQLKERFRPDLVHINLGNPLPIAYLHLQTQSAYPTPTLLALHNCFYGYPTNPNNVLVKALHTADWVTAGSHAMLEGALAVAPEIANRASLVLNCLLAHIHRPVRSAAQPTPPVVRR